MRYPIRETFPACCASADMQSAKSQVLSVKPMTVFLIGFVPVFFCSLLFAPCSLLFDDLVRPEQHVRRNREADLLRRLEIDDKVDLINPLHWQVLRFDTGKNALDVLR